MALSEAYTGTNGTWSSEYSLTAGSAGVAAVTTDGVYQLFLDCNALASTDSYRVRGYEKVRGADTQRVFLDFTLPTGAQATPIWCFPAFQLMNGWDFTLVKSAGTDRTITWSIRSIA